MIENSPAQAAESKASEPLAAANPSSPPKADLAYAGLAGAESVAGRLAGELLDAVDSGSSAALLEALSRIALLDPDLEVLGETSGNDHVEREKLEILRALAVQMRLDLHAMLMHIYQRIEASRGYLDIARHLAGRAPGAGADLGNALPRLGLERGIAPGGRELDVTGRSGEI